nr:Mur ligase family protein [Haloarchaeobius amylolyticus]
MRIDAEVVATCGTHHDRSREARLAVDDVRAAVRQLLGEAVPNESASVTDPRFVVEPDPTPAGELPADRNNWVWRFESAERVLAHSAERFPTEAAAETAVDRFMANATGALPVFMVGAEHEWAQGPQPITVGKPSLTGLVRELTRGLRHRQALQQVDTRIVVAGTRGKSSTTRRLDDVFNRRDYDTLTKITGDHPTLIHNGEVFPIEREGPRTTLYENISIIGEFAGELDAYDPEDVLIFENQGITEYTTRLVNQRLIDPDIMVLTNVRQDHTDTLGKTRGDIARAFARSVPKGTHVISGEQHPLLHEYMQRDIERRGGTIEQVDVPPEHEGFIGAETVHAINAVLAAVDESPILDSEIEAFLEGMQPAWTLLPNGRIYDAAAVNDIESTEMIRRALTDGEQIVPFVYLRRDRRGRTASFAEYVDLLYEHDHIEVVHVGGANARAFAANVDVPVVQHENTEGASAVLDELLGDGNRVICMGNAVDEFMRDVEAEIEQRVRAQKQVERISGEASANVADQGSWDS